MTLVSSKPHRRYRVVQWATGNIGMRALRAVIEHPNLDLVGLYVHSEAKAGRDAGELCGKGVNGIKATRSLDEIAALDADCVLYMPQGCNVDELCTLLASRKKASMPTGTAAPRSTPTGSSGRRVGRSKSKAILRSTSASIPRCRSNAGAMCHPT